MSESTAESHLNSQVEEHLDGFTRKWVSPGHAGVEDRLVFLPEGELWLIEMKDKGKKPSDAQWREIMKQRALGHNAGYLAGMHEVDEFVFAPDRKAWMDEHIKENYDG